MVRRTHDLFEVDPKRQERRRLFGKHLRFYPIRRSYIEEVKEIFSEQGLEYGRHDQADGLLRRLQRLRLRSP
jgi:hypothetical protein